MKTNKSIEEMKRYTQPDNIHSYPMEEDVSGDWVTYEDAILFAQQQVQEAVDEIIKTAESMTKEFVPADNVWEGDEEQEVGEWKLVPKEDGMYCLNCGRFIHEEGCICGYIHISDIISTLKSKHLSDNT
jgi:hypothetical protein